MSNHRFIEIDDEVREQVSSPNLDSKEMEYCVLSSQNELRQIVATNAKLTDLFVSWMVKDVDPFVRAALAKNPSINPIFIEVLSKDKNLLVISAASENPNLSASCLNELSKHRSYIVRTGVAANPNTKYEILELLAKDSEWGVRRSVAANPSASTELLDNLSRDEVSEIHIAVAENSNTSMSTLNFLWNSSSEARSKVLKNANCTEDFLVEVLQNALLPSQGQDETWSDDIRGDTYSRELIAERSELSRKLIEILIDDPSYYVRRKLAASTSLNENDLSKLALDTDEEVRQAVVNNPNTTSESKAAATLLGLPAKESNNE